MTTPTPVDATPPTPPSTCSARAVSPTQVDLSWTASTDNVGVTGYQVFRDGALLATTTGTGTGYSDTTASPSTTHSYQVRALDAANNLSAFSNTASGHDAGAARHAVPHRRRRTSPARPRARRVST